MTQKHWLKYPLALSLSVSGCSGGTDAQQDLGGPEADVEVLDELPSGETVLEFEGH